MRFTRNSRFSGEEGDAGTPADGGVWLDRFPALLEFLTAIRWDNGDKRMPGSLTLFTDGPTWKLCLSDKDASCIAFVTAACPEDAFAVASRGLETGSLDWRAQRDRPSNKRR